MKRIKLTLLSAATLLFCSLSASAGLPTVDSQGKALPTLAPMLEKTVPAVVNIFTRTRVKIRQNSLLSDPFFRHFFDLPKQPTERHVESLGSGVVVDARNGYILTNHHVIDQATEISVNLKDGRTLKAKVIGSDPDTDVAVIQVKPEKLVALKLSDSDRLQVGDFVVAIGNPFGLGQTVTSGIISALGRSGLGIEGYEDFIQTDASINPGNSGGALVNLRGELIGLNTAILSRSGGNVGIGFAIPSNMALQIMQQLIKHGEVRRGTLGAEAQDLTPELAAAFGLAEHQGAVVTQVQPGSAAEKAGLQAGDVITHVNERPIRNSSDVRVVIGLLPVGQVVKMKVRRNGDSAELKAVIRAPKLVSTDGGKLHSRFDGATFGNIVEGMPHYGKVEGVLVLKVESGSSAMRNRLKAGDIILQANRRLVKDIDELKSAVAGSDNLLLNIQRQGSGLFILLR